MKKQVISKIIPVVVFAVLLAACGKSTATPAATSSRQPTAVVSAVTRTVRTGVSATPAANSQAAPATSAAAIATPTAQGGAPHSDTADTVWDSGEVTSIVLSRDTITVDGQGATVDGSLVRITAAGAYEISGTLADGQIVVETDDKETVKLLLNGVDISNATSAPIYIADAKEVAIILADGSTNSVSDASTYLFPSADEDEPNAAIFSKADLTLGGNGSLTVKANYGDGITSKDGLVITGGQIVVDAVDDGIRGKDYLEIEGGTFDVTSGGDGLKSDEEGDATLGYVSIEDGVFHIDAGGDAIQAQTDVTILAGDFNLTTGGGSNASIPETLSAKALKAVVSLSIEGGTFVIDAADDAVHSNTNVAINGGDFTIATGDDGVHADENLQINGGAIRINDSYEGIESAVITINGGDLHIASSDDGINVAGGNNVAGGINTAAGVGGRAGRPGQDVFGGSGNRMLTINAGYIYVNAKGDGIDANGTIVMTGGTVIVDGPTQQMNGPLDHSGFTISGGFLAAVGSSGMAQTADATSTQNALLLNLNGTLQAGALIDIRRDDGTDILTFAAAKDIQSIAFSSPELVTGATYEVFYAGQSTGQVADGLYQGGTYSGGTSYGTFTVESVVTGVGNVSRFGGGGRRP